MSFTLLNISLQPNDDAAIQAMRAVIPSNGGITVITPNDKDAIDAAVATEASLVVAGAYGSADLLTRWLESDEARVVADLLVTTESPVLAVGLGFLVLMCAYGLDVDISDVIAAGAGKLEPQAEGTKIFQGSDPLCVTTNVRCALDAVPKKFMVLARSDSGIEAVRHRTKPLYGLQQLPVDFVYESDAKLVYHNFIAQLTR